MTPSTQFDRQIKLFNTFFIVKCLLVTVGLALAMSGTADVVACRDNVFFGLAC